MSAIRRATDLFESDLAGNVHTRIALQKEFSKEIGKGKTKVLKSTEIISRSRGRDSKTVPLSRKNRQNPKIDKKLEERAKAIVKHRKSNVRGAAGQISSEVVKNADTYDLWSPILPETSLIEAPRKAQMPSSLRKHKVLASIPAQYLPASIPLPHPGQSYNPSQPEHQALLGSALRRAQDEQAVSDQLAESRKQFETARLARQGKESWEMAEEQVGSGDDQDMEDGTETAAALRKTKAKTAKDRLRRRKHIAAERQAFRTRQLLKSQHRDLSSLPAIVKALRRQPLLLARQNASERLALARRVRAHGLSGLKGGKHRVQKPKLHFQLEDELADGLRLLRPEGSLWREWYASKERRGQVDARPEAAIKLKKRKGRATKMVERHDFKRFE